jgi:biotin transport system ATP-binding protein
MAIIEIKDLSHRYSDGTLALDSINLSICEGSFVVVAGANGSGKTTLFRHLNGLLQPSQGAVIVDGMDVAKNIRQARQQVGMVFQDADSQIIGETVFDDAAFGPENLCWPQAEIDRRVNSALTAVGLLEIRDRRPHLLSGGEKRRLAIAGIVAMATQVVLFDEPFSNLDYPGIRQLLQQMLDLHRTGHTLLVATHDLEKVIYHADRLILMAAGQIVRDGHPSELLTDVECFGVRAPCATQMGFGVQSWLNP